MLSVAGPDGCDMKASPLCLFLVHQLSAFSSLRTLWHWQPITAPLSLHACPLSGSDGLVKLWTIKTNECIKTLDAHQDKVWGLHGSRKDDKMVTGSADSNVTVWEVKAL